MVTKVFFSFDYERDLSRAEVVKNAWIREGFKALGLWHAPVWEEMKTQGQEAMKALIDRAIDEAEATAVLIGRETSQLSYVKYAVQKSYEAKKGLLGIYIHRIPDARGKVDQIGNAHFGELKQGSKSIFFWQKCPIHRWVIEDGKRRVWDWIEEAADRRP